MLIAYWILAGLLALAYLAAGGMKLAQPREKLVASGMGWAGDSPSWVVKLVGLLEALGALGLILPPLTGIATVLAPIAAIGLVLVQIGAAITHLARSEAKSLPANVVLLLLAAALAWIGFGIWA